MPHMMDETSCPMRHCNNCDKYRKEAEKYKNKYEVAKSGLTKEERTTLLELICNEQIKHLVARAEYESDRYKQLEELKAKIRIV